MKRRESPETRFGKVSRRSEPSSRGKRPFEVSRRSNPGIITAIIGWGVNMVIEGITVTALIARRINKEKNKLYSTEGTLL